MIFSTHWETDDFPIETDAKSSSPRSPRSPQDRSVPILCDKLLPRAEVLGSLGSFWVTRWVFCDLEGPTAEMGVLKYAKMSYIALKWYVYIYIYIHMYIYIYIHGSWYLMMLAADLWVVWNYTPVEHWQGHHLDLGTWWFYDQITLW